MKYLHTVLRDGATGEILENSMEDYSSLAEIRFAIAAKDEIHPGCEMWVWKMCQDSTCEMPFRIIHHVKRRRAGRRR